MTRPHQQMWLKATEKACRFTLSWEYIYSIKYHFIFKMCTFTFISINPILIPHIDILIIGTEY